MVDAFTGAGASTLGTVRDYILRCITTEDRLLEEDGVVIAQYAVDRTKLRETIAAKKKENFVFNLSRKCDACNHQMDMPCVFFICNHAFHNHCFEVLTFNKNNSEYVAHIGQPKPFIIINLQSYSDKDTECPACHPENKKIADIVLSQSKCRDQHDAFHHQLETAENGFSVVAEYFSR